MTQGELSFKGSISNPELTGSGYLLIELVRNLTQPALEFRRLADILEEVEANELDLVDQTREDTLRLISYASLKKAGLINFDLDDARKPIELTDMGRKVYEDFLNQGIYSPSYVSNEYIWDEGDDGLDLLFDDCRGEQIPDDYKFDPDREGDTFTDV
jgi:hypothetical protein